MGSPILLLMPVIFENGVTDPNALVTNVGARIIRGGGDQLTNNVLALVTKRTTERIIRASSLHRDLLKILLIKKRTDNLIIANFGRQGTNGLVGYPPYEGKRMTLWPGSRLNPESVPELDVDQPRLGVVGSAERQAIVEQEPAVQ